MKRNKKYIKNKKLRKFMLDVLADRKDRFKGAEYSLMRDGWIVQYQLSKEIKKTVIGEYLQQVLYLILDQKITETLDDIEAEFKQISKDDYNKLTEGQKLCFIPNKAIGYEKLKQCDWYYPTTITNYILDPKLRSYVVPMVYKNYSKKIMYNNTEAEQKAMRDNLYDKSRKIFNWSNKDRKYYHERLRNSKNSDSIKQMNEEVKEFM